MLLRTPGAIRRRHRMRFPKCVPIYNNIIVEIGAKDFVFLLVTKRRRLMIDAPAISYVGTYYYYYYYYGYVWASLIMTYTANTFNRRALLLYYRTICAQRVEENKKPSKTGSR